MCLANLEAMYQRADEIDLREGALAYSRYQQVMIEFADTYETTLDRALATFCALSPNSDYFGNLRSMASVLYGVQHGIPEEEITVSTYNHCRARAYAYATGAVEYLQAVKGPKIRSFYLNILNPADEAPVTIDGHMKAAYVAKPLTMKQALIGRREYEEIAEATRQVARNHGLIGNQVQAIIWFARKRTQNIKFSPQIGLFSDPTDMWGTVVRAKDAPPYKTRPKQDDAPVHRRAQTPRLF